MIGFFVIRLGRLLIENVVDLMWRGKE